MSTHASIIARLDDGRFHRIYVGHDGMPDGGVGETLEEHWNKPDAIAALIALGALSGLGPTLGGAGSIVDTTAYARDHGEKLPDGTPEQRAEVFDTLDEAVKGAEGYVYLWDDTMPPTREAKAVTLLRDAALSLGVFINKGYGEPATPGLVQRIKAFLPPVPPHPRWHMLAHAAGPAMWQTIPEAIIDANDD